MARSLSTFISLIQPLIRDRTNGTVEQDDIKEALNRSITRLMNEYGIYCTKSTNTLQTFNTVNEYSIPSDFHDLIQLKNADRTQPVIFSKVTPDDFWRYLTSFGDVIAVDGQKGTRKLLIKDTAGAFTVLNACDGDNGTWAALAVSDTTNVTTDEGFKYQGAASIRFDVDVSASGSNDAGIENSTMTQVDLTDYEGIATGFMDVYIPNVTNFTSVTLRWGSSSTDYWEYTATTNADGSSFVVGRNTIAFPWASATQTGTPTVTAVDYIALAVNYTASYVDSNGFRVDYIRFAMPMTREIDYYSTSFVQTTGGVKQAYFSATTDTSLLAEQDDDCLLYTALEECFWIKELMGDAQLAAAKAKPLIGYLKSRYASQRQREVKRWY
jgi:hypothetical protein